MWNVLMVILGGLALVFNTYSWLKYVKTTEKATRSREGWNAFYITATLLILIVLLSRIEKF